MDLDFLVDQLLHLHLAVHLLQVAQEFQLVLVAQEHLRRQQYLAVLQHLLVPVLQQGQSNLAALENLWLH